MKYAGIALLIGLLILVAVFAAILISRSGRSGYIEIDTPNVKTSMNLRGGWWSERQIVSGGKPIKVAARTYRPRYISLSAQKGEDEWAISGSGPWGKLVEINVEKGQTAVLKPGPPILVKTDVRSRRPISSIGLSFIGQAGEHYSPRVRTGRGTLPAPSVKIVDESGKVLASGKFRFG